MPVAASPTKNGVMKVISKEDRNYYTAEDVEGLLGVAQSKAYKVIRSLREELVASGQLLEEYPKGRVPKKYFNARCGID